MEFVEIVKIVENIENKIETLSDAKLGLLEALMIEGTDISFDVAHHLDYLVEFVETYSDENATLITESVNCGEILSIVLESARKHTDDKDAFIAESVEKVANIDIRLVEEEVETTSVTLLSIVTNTLTEMLGEETVENMPAEMVFDIVNASKELDLVENASEMDMVSLVEEISTKLEEAIKSGEIDFDSDDYTTSRETLSEFLSSYENTDDLLTEMAEVNEEILAESEDKDGVRVMLKAKDSTIMVEAKMEACPKGDMKCKQAKAKKAKEYFSKHELHGGGNAKDWTMDNLSGKLAKHVKAAAKASMHATGKPLSKEYIQYVLVPGIIKRMRIKNRRMNAKSKMKKQGMR